MPVDPELPRRPPGLLRATALTLAVFLAIEGTGLILAFNDNQLSNIFFALGLVTGLGFHLGHYILDKPRREA